jgi:hypothetical protein
MVGREELFKLTIGNESLHKTINDKGVGVANFATTKNIFVKSTMPHITKIINTLELLQLGRHTSRLILSERQKTTIKCT